MTAAATMYSSNGDSLPRPSTSAPATVMPTISHPHYTHSKAGESVPNLGDVDARCGGCKKFIDQESGGVVVAFGWVPKRRVNHQE